MQYKRRDFIKDVSLLGAGMLTIGKVSASGRKIHVADGKRVGIIGLDTSHVVAFTKSLNLSNDSSFGGFKIVAAYPKGSPDIEISVSRVAGYTDELKKMGVKIVNSIPDLLKEVDVVLLETNDGRVHLEQAIPVLKSGKRMFIDKPIAASLADAIAIFELSKKYNAPTFSSSSLRYMTTAQEVRNGKIGKVVGGDTFGPCSIEKTHPDFFWYGIHGVEILYTIMGTGCKELVRVHTNDTDYTVGTWEDDRIGTFRGTRSGKYAFGGTAFGENGVQTLGPSEGYNPLLKEITGFFQTGIPPVKEEETLEICAFMEAADQSRLNGGTRVSLDEIFRMGRAKAFEKLKSLD